MEEDRGQSQEGAAGWRETGWSGSQIFRTLRSRRAEGKGVGRWEDRRAWLEEEQPEPEFYKAGRTPIHGQRAGQLGWGLGECCSRNRKLRCWSRNMCSSHPGQGARLTGGARLLLGRMTGSAVRNTMGGGSQRVLPKGSSPRSERIVFQVTLEVDCLGSDNGQLKSYCPPPLPSYLLSHGLWKTNQLLLRVKRIQGSLGLGLGKERGLSDSC